MSRRKRTLPNCRRKLYDLVWSTPISRLAEKYGLSRAAIYKHCRRLGVPTPGRGYRQRVLAGKFAMRPRLRWVRDHPLVVQTRLALRNATLDTRQVLCATRGTYLHLEVTKRTLYRSLKFYDLLIKALEAKGYSVVITNRRKWTHVIIRGQHIPIGIREQVFDANCYPRQYVHWYAKELLSTYARAETWPSGRITLFAGATTWVDRIDDGFPIEHRIPEIIQGIEGMAARKAREAQQAAETTYQVPPGRFREMLSWLKRALNDLELSPEESAFFRAWLKSADAFADTTERSETTSQQHAVGAREQIPWWVWNKLRRR